MIFTQKVIKIGNSYGVIIPKVFADNLGWKKGTILDVTCDVDKQRIIISKKDTK